MEAPVSAAWVQTEDRYEQHDVEINQFLNNYDVANYVNGTDNRSLREKYEEIVAVTERLLHIATGSSFMTLKVNDFSVVYFHCLIFHRTTLQNMLCWRNVFKKLVEYPSKVPFLQSLHWMMVNRRW